MEITYEIKRKVFGQYLGQVAQWKNLEYTDKDETETMWDNVEYYIGNNAYLILTPISEITDEDAIEVAKIAKCKYCIADISDLKPHLLRSMSYTNVWNGNTVLSICQYLQSKGYDLPQYLLGGKTLQEVGLAIYE